MVRQVADTLNRSNIAMYAIDAKGVELDPAMDFSKRAALLGDQVRERDTSVLNAEQDARDSSKLLADRTGGLAFFGNNDVRGAVRRAFDDGRYAYNIAFYPNHGQWDGKFREIKIQSKAGLRLRYHIAQNRINTCVIPTDSFQYLDMAYCVNVY
jgi:VWFA-related protein